MFSSFVAYSLKISKFLDLKNQAMAVHGVNYFRMVGKCFQHINCEIHSHPEVFHNKGALKNFVKFIGKSFFLSLIELEAGGLKLYSKRDSGTCFNVNFAKFLRATASVKLKSVELHTTW